MKRDKPTYLLDATATIHFAKINLLNLIFEISNPYITQEVYRETVERGNAYPDALVIKDAIETGKLKVYQIKNQKLLNPLLRHPEIHLGEAETIAAAQELDGIAVIDEKEARVIADLYKVETAPGCLFLLFRLLKLNKITISQAEKALEKLLASGLYLDPLTLTKARQKLTEYQNEKSEPKQ